jgi:hypothetical protein
LNIAPYFADLFGIYFAFFPVRILGPFYRYIGEDGEDFWATERVKFNMEAPKTACPRSRYRKRGHVFFEAFRDKILPYYTKSWNWLQFALRRRDPG